MLLSQFEWKSRDSPTETRLTDCCRSTDSLSFVTPANFPRAVTVRRMANDVTYTMYAALPIHYVYNLWCVCVFVCLWAGLGNVERSKVQHQWMDGEVPVIVATISFGMGVDKANVRSVRAHLITLCMLDNCMLCVCVCVCVC